MKLALLASLLAVAAIAAAARAATSSSPQNGRLAYASTYQYNDRYGALKLVNANGTGAVQVSTSATNPDWSPDGRRLLFESARRGDIDLWAMNADGSGLKELTFSIGRDGDGSWSPDGSKIAFESDRARTPHSDVFVMNADGTTATRLTTTTGFDGDPAWSPDGRQIAYTSERSGSRQVWLMNADGSNQHRLTSGGGISENPAWSPTAAPSRSTPTAPRPAISTSGR